MIPLKVRFARIFVQIPIAVLILILLFIDKNFMEGTYPSW